MPLETALHPAHFVVPAKAGIQVLLEFSAAGLFMLDEEVRQSVCQGNPS
jgi:hypothetical protein